MRVRIKRLPQYGELDEYDLRHFRVGEVYEVSSQLGVILLVTGIAENAPAFDRTEAADHSRRSSIKERDEIS